jgi:hypothetical protein
MGFKSKRVLADSLYGEKELELLHKYFRSVGRTTGGTIFIDKTNKIVVMV